MKGSRVELKLVVSQKYCTVFVCGEPARQDTSLWVQEDKSVVVYSETVED
jgi:hypothetical protein